MKIKIIKAYKSDDGCIWESEQEAIDQNIDQCIDMLGHTCTNNNSNIKADIKRWFRDNPKEIRYILANINKVIDPF
jgi:hypothetical protein